MGRMNQLSIECPKCQGRFQFCPSRVNQRLARLRCPWCDKVWICRLQLYGALSGEGNGKVHISEEGGAPEDSHSVDPQQSVRVSDQLEQFKRPNKRIKLIERNPGQADSRKSYLSITFASVGCLTLLGAFLVQRERIIKIAPFSTGVYASLGLPSKIGGFAFREVRSLIAEDNSQRVLLVDGKIFNASSSAAEVPDLRVSVRANGGREVYRWDSPAPKKQLARGETVEFRVRLIAPPEDGRDIKVQFSEIESGHSASKNKPKAK